MGDINFRWNDFPRTLVRSSPVHCLIDLQAAGAEGGTPVRSSPAPCFNHPKALGWANVSCTVIGLIMRSPIMHTLNTAPYFYALHT